MQKGNNHLVANVCSPSPKTGQDSRGHPQYGMKMVAFLRPPEEIPASFAEMQNLY